MIVITLSMIIVLPWETTNVDRYNDIAWSHHGFFPYPVRNDNY
jgi:hypothetical protein